MSDALRREDGANAAEAVFDVLGPAASGPVRAIDWIVTLPFLVAFGLILLLFDPLQRLSRPFGERPHEIVVGVMQAALLGSFRLCGVRLSIERAPAVAPRTPYILIANHQSMFDIPIIGALLFSNYPKYVSKRELSRGIPSISYNLRRGGNALIDRSDRAQAERAIHDLGVYAQRRGVSVVIYPEGTRARAGGLGPFKRAGTFALLAAAPDLEVVPVVIDGSWKLLSRNLLPVPFGVRIRVRFAEPIRRSEAGDAEAVLERTRLEIESTLIRWRSEAAEPARSR